MDRVAVRTLLAAAALLPAAAFAQSPAPAEPAKAPEMAAPAAGDTKVTPQPTFMAAKWKAKFYGFVELDTYYDDTQSFSEIQGHGLITAPSTPAKANVAADNGRFQFTPRNSRLGFSLETPDWDGTKATATIEGDFFGFDPSPYGPSFCTAVGTAAGATSPSCTATSAGNATQSEGGFYNNPTFRIRHAFLKVTSPYVDITAGQYWSLFGWDTNFMPATVALQGIVGEVYQRTQQIRLGKAFGIGDAAKAEIQVAALRPYQRDAVIPDLSAGLRFEYGGWKGYKSTGGTGGGNAPLQVALTGVMKQFKAFKVTTSTTTPATQSESTDSATGTAIALGALVPVIPPASDKNRAGAMTLVAQATIGSGYNDAFTSLNAGATANAPGVAAVTTNFDPGAAGYRLDTSALDTVQYKSLLVNLQYYFPIADGNVWFTGVFSELGSDNSYQFNKTYASVLADAKYFSAGLMWDFTPATRLGLEFVRIHERIGDQTTRDASRGNLSLWYVF